MRTEQPTKCLYHISYGESSCAHKTSLSPQGIRYRPFQGGGSDVVLCCLFWCQSIGDVSPYVCLGKKAAHSVGHLYLLYFVYLYFIYFPFWF